MGLWSTPSIYLSQIQLLVLDGWKAPSDLRPLEVVLQGGSLGVQQALCSLSLSLFFSVEHLPHSGVWVLGVEPSLGTPESDNSQACPRSQRDWVLRAGRLPPYGDLCKSPDNSETHKCDLLPEEASCRVNQQPPRPITFPSCFLLPTHTHFGAIFPRRRRRANEMLVSKCLWGTRWPWVRLLTTQFPCL